MGTYHVLVQPGTIPMGYRADCVEHSRATHNIPLDYSNLCGDYNTIMEVSQCWDYNALLSELRTF